MGQRAGTPPPPYTATEDSTQDPMVPLRLTESMCRTLQEQIEIYKQYTALKYSLYNARCQYHSLDLRPDYGPEQRKEELARLVCDIQQYKNHMTGLEEKLDKNREEVKKTNTGLKEYIDKQSGEGEAQ